MGKIDLIWGKLAVVQIKIDLGNKKINIKLTLFLSPSPGSSSLLHFSVLYPPLKSTVWWGTGGYGLYIVVSLCWCFCSLFSSASPWAAVLQEASSCCGVGCSMGHSGHMLWWHGAPTPPPPLTLVFLCCFSLFLHPPLLIVWHFCPFLNMFSQRCHPLGWGDPLCPGGSIGAIWSRLCLAWGNPGLSWEGPPLQLLTDSAWAWTPDACCQTGKGTPARCVMITAYIENWFGAVKIKPQWTSEISAKKPVQLPVHLSSLEFAKSVFSLLTLKEL